MNKQTINIPKDIKFLSEWKEFNLPGHPHILNKQITGCGFTQWCLTNDQNVILCSPRRILLENKEDQYLENGDCSENHYKILYAKNDSEEVIRLDIDLSKTGKIKKSKEAPIQETLEYVQEYKRKIKEFYLSCVMSGKFCKILVTYDSYRKVREALEEIEVFNQFYIVVDEFQSIFTDSRFKASTELEFVNHLQGVTKLCYASATPMMEKYLDKLEEFKDLPYYELDWIKLNPNRLMRPKISSTPCTRMNQQVLEIIEKYRTGQWRDIDGSRVSWIGENGLIQEVVSKEAIFYINSVKNICDIIRHSGLKQEECNILVAGTEENREAIRKAFKVTKKNFQGLGKVPKKSEMGNNKMFTFCTRTVYLGADFYSTCARSFVFSDANIDSLAVDITLDLPQILGRQRLEENPWKNELNIYFKPTVDKNRVSKEEFNAWIERKMLKSNTALEMFYESLQNGNGNRVSELLETYETIVLVEKYKNHYVSIDRHSGSEKLLKFNNLVLISEERAFDIQQVDYADRCMVRSSINNQFSIDDAVVSQVLGDLENKSHFTDKMKFLCTSLSSPEIDSTTRDEILRQVDRALTNYYLVLGPERIHSLAYRRDRLEKEYTRLTDNQSVDISSQVYSVFSIGDKYSSADLKVMLKNLYEDSRYRKTPKAQDLEEWFDLRPIKLKDSSGKWVHGFEIIKKKGQD